LKEGRKEGGRKRKKRILYMKIDIGFYVYLEANSLNIQQTEKKDVAEENETNIHVFFRYRYLGTLGASQIIKEREIL
jgi:hypothetical protein